MSATMFRFRPAIFFPRSTPWVAAGTLVEVLTLWESMMQAVGSGSRTSLTRIRRRRSPLSCSNTPSRCHRAK
ncbi:hypothetical protein ACZ90_70540 [Streptomyces albus subsp. albus]|nr:hypothetical protein ACZ90_70540 [Streptomyces albus subsp. albus]